MHLEKPPTADLVMDGPVLAFGGCYGNLEATRALLDAAAELAIPPERTIGHVDALIGLLTA